MIKPVLVIMAAGMGSRYGGLKQIDPIDEEGHNIMDLSVYDARQAGFEKVIFIIKKENEAIFREVIGDRVARVMEVEYAFQDLHDIPEGFTVPEGRQKPWGTGQAVLAAYDQVHGPFAVINADDYYGKHAFSLIYDFLVKQEEEDQKDASSQDNADNAALAPGDTAKKEHYAMIGYILKNTVTENGSVARGICSVSPDGYLQNIVERTRIIKTPAGTAFSEDDGKTWTNVSPESLVSMNIWGFSCSFLDELKNRFPAFLEKTLKENPLKGEYFLPFVVNEVLAQGRADAKVLPTPDKWFGVTYKEDHQTVVDALKRFKAEGLYPQNW